MDWQEVKGAFLQDGSLRDIYVVDSGPGDWPAVLHFLRVSKYDLRFSRGGQVQALPIDAGHIIEESSELTSLLQVDIGGPVLHCHFFPDEEIEFDLDPQEVLSFDAAEKVFSFMSQIGSALKKPVHLTGENMKKWLLFAYEPLTGQIVKKTEYDMWR